MQNKTELSVLFVHIIRHIAVHTDVHMKFGTLDYDLSCVMFRL